MNDREAFVGNRARSADARAFRAALCNGMRSSARYLSIAEIRTLEGPVISVDEALSFKAQHPGSLTMGELDGRRIAGFDLSNSPARAARADLTGRTLVQRTSAGTRGVVAASLANPTGRQWCASLVCASATARAVALSGLGAPTYIVTGRFSDHPVQDGAEDAAAAQYIERARLGLDSDPAAVASP